MNKPDAWLLDPNTQGLFKATSDSVTSAREVICRYSELPESISQQDVRNMGS